MSTKRPSGSGDPGGEAGPERPVRKNHFLRQSKIDMARRILGVRTETEALEGALDMLIYGDALAAGTAAMSGEGYLDHFSFGGPEAPDSESA